MFGGTPLLGVCGEGHTYASDMIQSLSLAFITSAWCNLHASAVKYRLLVSATQIGKQAVYLSGRGREIAKRGC